METGYGLSQWCVVGRDVAVISSYDGGSRSLRLLPDWSAADGLPGTLEGLTADPCDTLRRCMLIEAKFGFEGEGFGPISVYGVNIVVSVQGEPMYCGDEEPACVIAIMSGGGGNGVTLFT